jgi:hypothetical protein
MDVVSPIDRHMRSLALAVANALTGRYGAMQEWNTHV